MSAEGALSLLAAYTGGSDEKLTLRSLLLKRIQSLQAQPSSSVTIDDLSLTHHVFLTNTFKPFVASSSLYMRHPVHGNVAWNTKLRIPLFPEGDFLHDMALKIQIGEVGGGGGGNGSSSSPGFQDLKYRYCRYPGIRLLKEVALFMNGKKIDSYGPQEMLFFLNYELHKEKRDAFKVLIGESLPTHAECYNVDFEYTQRVPIENGYQTYKSRQPPLLLTIPLLFWFNKDLSKALPIPRGGGGNKISSSSSPFSVWIEVTLADSADILQAAIFHPSDNTMRPVVSPRPGLDTIELLSNNIFVNPEVRSFYFRNISRYLITLHNSQTKTIAGTDTSVLLNEVKEMGMTQSLFFAFQPYENIRSFEDWHSFSFSSSSSSSSWFPIPMYINTPSSSPSSQNVFFMDIRRAHSATRSSPIENFTLSLDTIPIIQKMEPQMFSAYLPALLSTPSLASPGDPGIYFLPFHRDIFNPQQPTGHVNFSKFNQIKLDWTFSGENRPLENTYQLYISATILDFLVINERSIELMSNLL